MAPPHWSVSGGPSRTAIEDENFEIIIKNIDNFASNDLLKMIYIIHQLIDSVNYQDSSIMETVKLILGRFFGRLKALTYSS